MALTAYYPTNLNNYIYSDISVPVSIIGPIENGLPGPSDHLPVVYTGNELKVLSYNTSFVTSYIVNNQKFGFGAGDNVILKYLRLLLAINIIKDKDIDALESLDYFLMFSEFSRQIVKNFFENQGSCAGLQEQNHTTAGVIKTITDICLQGGSLQYQTGAVFTSMSTYPTLLTIWDIPQLGSELIRLNSPVLQPPPMYKDKDGSDIYGGKYDILEGEDCKSYVADLGSKATSNSVLRDKAAIYAGYGYKNATGTIDDGRPIMITLVGKDDTYTLLVNFHAPNFPKYVTQTGQGPINIDTSREYVKNLIQAHVMKSLENIGEEDKTKITKVIVMCDSNDTEGKLSLEFKIGKRNFFVVFSTLRVKSCCVNCDSNDVTTCSNDIVSLPSYSSLSKYTTTEEMEKAYNINSEASEAELKETFYAKNFKFYGDYAAVLVGVDAPRGGRHRFRTKKHRKHHRRITKKRRHRNTKKRHRRNRNHRRSTKH
jgi:hypothetical protein